MSGGSGSGGPAGRQLRARRKALERNYGEPVDSDHPHYQQPPGSARCAPCAAAAALERLGVTGPIVEALAADTRFLPGQGMIALDLHDPLNRLAPVPGRVWVSEDRFPDVPRGAVATPEEVAAELRRAVQEGGGVALVNVRVHARGNRPAYEHLIAVHEVTNDGHVIISDPEAPGVTRSRVTEDGFGEVRWAGDVTIARAK